MISGNQNIFKEDITESPKKYFQTQFSNGWSGAENKTNFKYWPSTHFIFFCICICSALKKVV
jgi:hypothetical protein